MHKLEFIKLIIILWLSCAKSCFLYQLSMWPSLFGLLQWTGYCYNWGVCWWLCVPHSRSPGPLWGGAGRPVARVGVATSAEDGRAVLGQKRWRLLHCYDLWPQHSHQDERRSIVMEFLAKKLIFANEINIDYGIFFRSRWSGAQPQLSGSWEPPSSLFLPWQDAATILCWDLQDLQWNDESASCGSAGDGLCLHTPQPDSKTGTQLSK